MAYRQGTALPDTAAVRNLVTQLSSGQDTAAPVVRAEKITRGAVWSEYENLAAQGARSEGRKVFHVVAHIDPLCAMPIAARQLVANAVSSIAQILGSRPEAGAPVQGQTIELLLATSHQEAAIVAKCQIPTVIGKTTCSEFAAKPAPEAAADASDHEQQASSEAKGDGEQDGSADHRLGPQNMLRVDAERIDNVLNLVGELIIGKSMMQQAIHEHGRHSPKDPLRARFADAMSFQARVLNDLQRSVMKIRMVPVEQLFRRFPRMIRDTAQRCGREVSLHVTGQDTDLDKSLLDAIAEPLTHIVRNAVAHGLESPAERKAAGKPVAGTLSLNAYHQANQLIVEVSDDGRGIDVEKVKAKGIRIGLVSAEGAASMTDSEILDLIFRPGFSTAEEITEVSGRGVGLDVVRSVLHRLKGTVELETHPGTGTKFRLKLPLTLAIIKALLFRVEQRLYAIPLNSVAEIARAREGDLHHVDSWEVLQLRGQVLPLMRLGEKPTQDAEKRNSKIFVLVIHFAGRKLGLMVDALEGEEELVIKALDDQTIATDLVSGASILGDGRVVLIMNLPAVVDRFTSAHAGTTPEGLFLSGAGRTARVAAAGVQQ